MIDIPFKHFLLWKTLHLLGRDIIHTEAESLFAGDQSVDATTNGS
jgi:hypothetical protein